MPSALLKAPSWQSPRKICKISNSGVFSWVHPAALESSSSDKSRIISNSRVLPWDLQTHCRPRGGQVRDLQYLKFEFIFLRPPNSLIICASNISGTFRFWSKFIGVKKFCLGILYQKASLNPNKKFSLFELERQISPEPFVFRINA